MRLKLLQLQHLLSQVSSNRKMFQKGFVLSKITGGQSSAPQSMQRLCPVAGPLVQPVSLAVPLI